jgi:hypothetical protein
MVTITIPSASTAFEFPTATHGRDRKFTRGLLSESAQCDFELFKEEVGSNQGASQDIYCVRHEWMDILGPYYRSFEMKPLFLMTSE